MALTTLDAKTALVVIDLQRGIVALPTAHPTAEVVQRAALLTEAFRRHGLPVVLVNVAGGAPGRADQTGPKGDFPAGFADLVPELNQQPSDHVVTKRTWGAFTNTDLQAYLQQQGVTQVVLLGVATSIGVESTAHRRNRYDAGSARPARTLARMSESASPRAAPVFTLFFTMGTIR